MTKPTDDEIGRLLRETFADKEELVESLPEASKSKHRRTGPILLAAASVAAVLGGILYAADRANQPGPGQAQATTTAPASNDIYVLPDDQLIWAAAITEILTIERPAAGWLGVNVLDVPTRGQPFTEQEKSGIGSRLSGVPVQWVADVTVGAQDL